MVFFIHQLDHVHKPAGSVGLIHPESHFTDEKAGLLREATYRRLRRHWQFMNALMLFEVHDQVSYGVHVYSGEQSPGFEQATSLYHPSTVEGSLKHDGSGSEPGLKDDEGHWDLRAHRSRIQHVNKQTLTTWHAVLESGNVPVEQTRMVYSVNRATAAVLEKLAAAPRIGSLGLRFSAGWHEKNDRTKGYFDSEWGVPESWDSVILQGPHLHVGNPFYKTPNKTMLHNQDWTPVDLEALPVTAIPATQYKPAGNPAVYRSAYGMWEPPSGPSEIRSHFRIAWRAMAANTGERTLIPTLIPPGAAHIHGVSSAGTPEVPLAALAEALGFMCSIVSDFQVRVAPKSAILMSTLDRLPANLGGPYSRLIAERVVRLTALTEVYAPIWESVMRSPWSAEQPYRRALERRMAAIEIDALVSLALGVTIEELVTIYRTQFPVLYKYDHDDYLYDTNGRIVPTNVRQNWRRHGEPADSANFPINERTFVHPDSGVTYQYDLPFQILDREADLRSAYASFSQSCSNPA